jgi:superfamily II DNA helicase RecQ
MPVRVFTVSFDPAQGRFDDAAMVAALEGCRVLSLSDHAFTVDGTPVLALTVRFEPPPPPPGTAAKPSAPRNRPQDALADVDKPLFEALRTWRNTRAKKDGRPAYVLFTNAQLTEIATRRPSTKAALQAIDGIGDARVEGYGDDVLAVVAKVPRGAAAAEAAPSDG